MKDLDPNTPHKKSDLLHGSRFSLTMGMKRGLGAPKVGEALSNK